MRPLSILISRPKLLGGEELRLRWLAAPDPIVASAGWALTSERARGAPVSLDLPGLLDTIESEMLAAPARL